MKNLYIFGSLMAFICALGAEANTNLRAKLAKHPELREAICTVGVGALEDNAINFEALKQVPKDKVVLGLKAIKENLGKNKMMKKPMAQKMMAHGDKLSLKEKMEKYPEIAEGVCTVGMETLEDNGINLELLRKVPKDKVVMGLKAIIDDLVKNKLMPAGPAGKPAEMGTSAPK